MSIVMAIDTGDSMAKWEYINTWEEMKAFGEGVSSKGTIMPLDADFTKELTQKGDKMTKKELQRKMTELEGKEIFIYCNGKKSVGIVSGADYYVGLTIQDKYNKDLYYLCVHGKYDPQWKNSPISNEDWEKVKKIYGIVIKYAEKDYFDLNEMEGDFVEISVYFQKNASAISCPFSQ